MTKSKIVAPTLISCGLIIPELHFGPFSRNWWLETITDNGQELFPICVGMSIVTELNGRNFTVRVFKGSEGQPGYICESGEYIGEEKDHISNALNTLYQKIFKKKTKYSGVNEFGLDNLLILEKLLDGVLFRPFSVMVEKYKIFIYGLGVSDSEDWHGAGTGYMSSFISDYKRKRCLFLQSIKNKLCCIDIYDDGRIIAQFEGKTPNEVWAKLYLLQRFSGDDLFGLKDSNIQKKLTQHQKPTCTFKDWNNLNIMESFSDIIELQSELASIYPSDHIFNERECRAWKALIKAAGDTNITPFDKKESMCEFWTKNSNPSYDKATLLMLYNKGFLSPTPNEPTCDLLICNNAQRLSKNLIHLVSSNNLDKELKANFIHRIELLRRHMKLNYEKEIKIETDGQPHHDPCISHCLLYAFGICEENHANTCQNCDEFWILFENLQDTIDTIAGVSDWYSWKWPIDEESSGFIFARELPNVGDWTKFSPTKINGLIKQQFTKPEPMFTPHSMPKEKWSIPIPDATGESIRKKQKKFSENTLCNEIDHFANVNNDTYSASNFQNSDFSHCDVLNLKEGQCIEDKFPLKLGWAIKGKQKFGKKGCGKRMPKIIVDFLKTYFHSGNYDKSQRYTPESMHQELVEEANNNNNFTLEQIPKVETIRNWISRYSSAMKKDISDKIKNSLKSTVAK
ncbi:2348_t:CDS:10 [Entrophospora sp. SA101]|nr:2348_t:CDS:10 [Entrophospora sp. SA101]